MQKLSNKALKDSILLAIDETKRIDVDDLAEMFSDQVTTNDFNVLVQELFRDSYVYPFNRIYALTSYGQQYVDEVKEKGVGQVYPADVYEDLRREALDYGFISPQGFTITNVAIKTLKEKRAEFIENYEQAWSNVKDKFPEMTDVMHKIEFDRGQLYPGVFDDVWRIFLNITFDYSVPNSGDTVNTNFAPMNSEDPWSHTLYKRPDIVPSIEYALIDWFRYADKTWHTIRGSKPDFEQSKQPPGDVHTAVYRGYEGDNVVTAFLNSKQKGWENDFLAAFPPGTVLTKDELTNMWSSELRKFIDNNYLPQFKEKLQRRYEYDLVDFIDHTYGFDKFMSHVEKLLPKVGGYVLTPGMSHVVMSNRLRKAIDAGEDVVSLVRTFRTTAAHDDMEKVVKTLSRVFTNIDLSNRNLANIDLSGLTIDSTSFNSTVFNKDADFDVARIHNCDVDGMDFGGMTLGGRVYDMLYNDNHGEFANYSVSVSLDYEKDKAVSLQHNEEVAFTRAVPIDVPSPDNYIVEDPSGGFRVTDDRGDVVTVVSNKPDAYDVVRSVVHEDAEILLRILERIAPNVEHGVESAMLGLDSLFKFSQLSEPDADVIRNWIRNPNQIPEFVDKSDPVSWARTKGKSGEFSAIGLGKREVGKIFALVNAMTVGKTPQQIQEEKKRAEEKAAEDAARTKQEAAESKINEIVGQYGTAETFDMDGILNSVFRIRGSYIESVLSSRYAKDAALSELIDILESSLRGDYVSVIKPRRPYNSFSVKSLYLDLVEEGWGRDRQFGIGVDVDFNDLPSDIAQYSQWAKDRTHMKTAGAQAWSRLCPITSTTIDSDTKQPIVKSVWQITEMQNDQYQETSKIHGLGDERGNEKVINEKGRAFRDYYKHWPEVVLNEVIRLAVNQGVDEIWMPRGVDVYTKTFTLDKGLKDKGRVGWSDYYDRPAKKFGGESKNVGHLLVLDPGSYYDVPATKDGARARDLFEKDNHGNNVPSVKKVLEKFYSDSFYVIDLAPHKQQVASRLLFGNVLRFSQLSGAEQNVIDQAVDRALDAYRNVGHSNFGDVVDYVDEAMLLQNAYNDIVRQIIEFREKRDDVKQWISQRYGVDIYDHGAPNWYEMLDEIWKAFLTDLDNHRRLDPTGAVSNEEFARDWYRAAFEELRADIDPDIYGAPWYRTLLLPTIRTLLNDRGFGDVTREGPIVGDPDEKVDDILRPDTGEPGDPVLEGPPDTLLPDPDVPDTPIFEEPDESELVRLKQEMIDQYLDELVDARERGDVGAVERIEQNLRSFITESRKIVSSLRLRHTIESGDLVQVKRNVGTVSKIVADLLDEGRDVDVVSSKFGGATAVVDDVQYGLDGKRHYKLRFDDSDLNGLFSVTTFWFGGDEVSLVKKNSTKV